MNWDSYEMRKFWNSDVITCSELNWKKYGWSIFLIESWSVSISEADVTLDGATWMSCISRSIFSLNETSKDFPVPGGPTSTTYKLG